MDTTALGAITPTQVQDNNQGPTQVSLSPRSQRLDTLRPPQSPVLADVVAQLQVLMASVQLRQLPDSSAASCIPYKQKSR